MEFSDQLAISELINAWGVYRDQGKWKELRGTFAPDGHISVSWFRGPFEQFVERCRTSFAANRTWSRHHLFAPTIRLDKDRAVAETPVIIRVRQKFGAVEADLTAFSRFLDRVERRTEGWLIAERAAIYERDRLDPVEPSPAFDALFEAAETAHYPEQYRYMAFRLAHAEGRSLAPVIYRDGGALGDQPTVAAALDAVEKARKRGQIGLDRAEFLPHPDYHRRLDDRAFLVQLDRRSEQMMARPGAARGKAGAAALDELFEGAAKPRH